ncbi:MAG: glycosyl transferase family protein [Bacteroidota bacterium]|jgi:glycosyltransferase involved in cell wall biosynthesis|nr:glycosyl transferase family protein [Bacteroidota bacterium]
MSKKQILVFIDWYLPGYKAGGPIQSVANLVAHLRDDYDFSIVTRDTDYCETIPYPNIKSNEWNVLVDGTRVYYFSEDQLTRSNIRKLIKETNFDYLYLNGIFSLYFTLIPLFFMRKKRSKPVIVAARGMFAESALEVKKVKKKVFMKAVQLFKLFHNVTFHATNETEKADIVKVLGEAPVKIAGNLFQKEVSNKLSLREKPSGFIKLVNVARIAPEKNLLYALKVLRQVKENVEFDFYGPVYNQEYWAECKFVLDEMPPNVKANYKGSVESSRVLKLLEQYHMLFMPTAGENFGHIILQALSAGCPVLISDQTPWKDLSNKKVGWDLSLASISDFATIIDSCAKMGQAEYNSLSESSFDLARKYSANEEILRQNKDLFR